MREIIYYGYFILMLLCVVYSFYINIYIKDLKRSIPVLLLIIICIITYLTVSDDLISRISIIVLCLFIICNTILRYKDNIVIKTVKGNINYYNQKDRRWGLKKYSASIFSFCGCGPSVIAMIASFKNPDITPIDIKLWLYTYAPSYLCQSGTKIDALAEYCSQHNIPWKSLGKHDKQTMIEGLNNGAMFAIVFKKHIVLLANVNMKYVIIDPLVVNRILFTDGTKFIDKIFKMIDFNNSPYPIIGVYI